MSGNPFMHLIQGGVDIIDPIGTRLRGQINFEPFIWLGTGHYEIEKMGSFSYIGENALISGVKSIGRFCSIARNVVMGESEHPTTFLSSSPIFYSKRYWKEHSFMAEFYKNNHKTIINADSLIPEKTKAFEQITIGNDVWIGEGVFIRRGVTIGDGAIIASRAVVNKDVKPYEIVGGVPAKTIKMRFAEDVVDRLIKLQWWNYDIRQFNGVDVTNIVASLDVLEALVQNNKINKYEPKTILWG